ncbi:MAG: hypothetical protein IKW28_10505 [Lachnospiraceae bacterium]|nr:hypothetical protein [Lachnospiraceae bacterium]
MFGTMFDMNRDGKLDAWERAIEFQFITSMQEEEEDNLTELEIAGIDPIDLEYMNEYERRAVLEEAGLDPDDYDF